MSLTTVRVLQIIAAALFLLALLSSILVITFQAQIKMMYTDQPEVIAFRSAPIGPIINILIRLLIAMVYLLLVFALKPSKGGSIAVVIILLSLLILDGVLISPAVSLLAQASANAYGSYASVSYSIVNSAAGTLSSFFTAPAYILMVISMGGYWGQNARKAGFPSFPAGSHNM